MIALFAAVSLLVAAPELPRLPEIKRDPQITYVDRSGAVLGVRGGRYAPPVDLARLPAYVPAAFVSIEDRRFYEHAGVDPLGIARAVVANVSEGRLAQGASTITQQLARNLFLSADRTVERKALEVVYAAQLEQAYSKRQILGLYLSRVYFGSGAYGLEAAARRYYDKPASRLTLMEAATLAGVLKSPTNYNPAERAEAAAQRARLVLDAMVETGAITAAERAKALKTPAKALKSSPTESSQYFVDWLDGQTRQLVGAPKQDLVVETTLDLSMERAAVRAVGSTLSARASQRIEQAALVAVDGQGRVRAMIGGRDYSTSSYNRAVQARRQAGSAWKPFVYLAALEAGRTPDDLVLDEPLTIGAWSPQNYSQTFSGVVTFEHAVAQSLNTVAARLADEVGRERVAATARRLGITSSVNTDPAMALGTTLVSPLEMAQAYGAFSNGGQRVTAYGVERIRTSGGTVIWRRKAPAPRQAVGNPALGELNRMLRTVIASGTGVRAAVPGYDLAGKTGTTSDYKDAWFAGYTGGLATVVWMGRDDGSPMAGVTGGGAPAEAWRAFMSASLKRAGAQAIPPGPPAPVAEPVADPIGALLPPEPAPQPEPAAPF